MGNLMNSYFYGKAGQGDYTVEQMPTTRKQLFFTTLKVRFSSMIGLNLVYLLFVLPLILWVFVAWQTVTLYLTDEAYTLGGDEMEAAYYEYADLKERYTAITDVDTTLATLNNTLEGIEYDIAQVKEGKEVLIEVPAVVEGGESTTRAVTLEELETQKAETEAAIAEAEANKLLGEDEEYMEELKTEYSEAYSLYYQYNRAAMNGNISMSLLIMIPLIALAGVGHTGQMYVLRNWARDEHAFMWQDFKNAIKGNWKQGLLVGIFNGLSIFLFFTAYVTYGNMASAYGKFYIVPQMLMVVMLVLWWMMNEIIFPMMVTYDMKLKQLLKNSLIMVLAKLPISFVILLGIVAVPLLIYFLIPYPAISMLILIVIYGLFGFSLVGFIKASYANSLFDKFLNPRIEGAEVNKGLYKPEDDDDEPEEKQEEPAKEDRFWEHKTE